MPPFRLLLFLALSTSHSLYLSLPLPSSAWRRCPQHPLHFPPHVRCTRCVFFSDAAVHVTVRRRRDAAAICHCNLLTEVSLGGFGRPLPSCRVVHIIKRSKEEPFFLFCSSGRHAPGTKCSSALRHLCTRSGSIVCRALPHLFESLGQPVLQPKSYNIIVSCVLLVVGGVCAMGVDRSTLLAGRVLIAKREEATQK